MNSIRGNNKHGFQSKKRSSWDPTFPHFPNVGFRATDAYFTGF